MAEMESSVSISITSAIVYVVSGLVFFFLVFLLVMMGVTNCNWHCEGGSVGKYREIQLGNTVENFTWEIMMGVTNCNWQCEGGSVFEQGDEAENKDDRN